MHMETEVKTGAPAGEPEEAAQPRGKSILRDVAETIALFLVVFTLSQTLLGNFMIEQRSAWPHFIPGDRILVDKVLYHVTSLQRGDMIVGRWQSDPTDVFKRIIALPGERVDIVDNKIQIDGQPLDETYLEPGVITLAQGKREWVLGPDEYFVMGDNRTESGDSRTRGPMLLKDIVGRAWLRYWPLNKLMLVQ
jgi:signal peptidase I